MTDRILVVEDEPGIRDAVEYALVQAGYAVEAVETAAAALEHARRERPDVIVLDVMLPDGSGIDVCRTLRAEGDVPIVMLTARGSELDRVLGLEVGADDYVVKPFSLAELVSRIRALLRRRSLDRAGGRPLVVLGDLRIDHVRHEVSVGDGAVALTPAEFRLLAQLAREPGRVFGRDELMAELWATETPGWSRACDTHVANLRRKLGPRVPIETVRGVGYRLGAVSGNPDRTATQH